jgi:hypothetical protein
LSKEENIDEDNLKEQPIDSNKESEYENIPQQQTTVGLQPTIPTSEIKDMEVHHHTHVAHGRKTWKDYFWEFLMLFLAVFAGFLAENQREHFIENRREKQYMLSMINDLRSDTSMLSGMYNTFTRVINHIDSLTPLLQPATMDENPKEVYQHQVMINLFHRWIYSDRTISQLKNSGNFRLIRNKSVSDQIMAYDGFIINYVGDMQENYILPLRAKISDAGNEIFKTEVLRKFLKTEGWKYHAVLLPETPYFITFDKNKLGKFINGVQQYAVAIEWANGNIKKAIVKAVQLDSLIRKEYQLH